MNAKRLDDYIRRCWVCGHQMKKDDIFGDICNRCALKDVTPPDTIQELKDEPIQRGK